MAVPNQPTPTWRSIPNQSLYPGERIVLNLRNYQTRQDATITLRTNPSTSWITYSESGLHRNLIIAPPADATAGAITVLLTASAFVTSSATTETRTTSFTVTVQPAVAPTFTAVAQAVQAGVPRQIDLSRMLDIGTGLPAPTYAFRSGYTPPSGIAIEGHLLAVVLAVADYPADDTLTVQLQGTNSAGTGDFDLTLNVAHSELPSLGTAIPAQYAVQGEAFSLDIASNVSGTPAPTVLSTGLPSWMAVNGYVLSGVPVGYTQNTTETVDLTLQNAAGDTTVNFDLHVRVFSDTFQEPDSGSPVTVAHNNLTCMAATPDRLFYASSDAVGTVYRVEHDGTAQSSETITLPTANNGSTAIVHGLATDGAFLYILGGFQTEFVWKYDLDTAAFSSINVSGAANAIALPVVNGTQRLAVLRTTGVVQFWSTDFTTATPLPLLAFTPSIDGTDGTDLRSMVYDTFDDRLYIGEDRDAKSLLYAFTPGGDRVQSEAVRLDTANTDPRGVGYDDDILYVAQGDSGQSTGRVYLYSSLPRILPVPAQEGFDGEAWSVDLAPYLQNDIDVSFKDGYTVPSWLSLNGKVLSASALPAVTRSRQDDLYTIQLTGTHTDRTQDFSVDLTVKYIEAPAWSALSAVTLDQDVTPQMPANPPLVTSVTLHLTDFIEDLDRAGTITFAVTDQENSGLRTTLTSRVLNGITYNDVLTIHSQSVLTAQQATASFSLRLSATNVITSAFQELPVDVNKLSPVYINAIPAQEVQLGGIDSLDLRRYGGGMPPPTWALGTITPNLTEDVATVISNANGQWSIHPNAALRTTRQYTVQVYAINRISRTQRTFQLTVDSQQRPVPNVAPVWHDDLHFDINTGETLHIELLPLINAARPTPTFSVSSSSDLMNFGAHASISGTTLTVSIPADIDQEVHGDLEITARNSEGGAIGTLEFTVHVVSAPVWSGIPHQQVRPGQTWSLDLNRFVTAMPAAAITFTSEPTGMQSGATLTSGVVTWIVPESYTADTVEPFGFTATNSAGSQDVTVGVSVITDAAPVWTTDTIVLDAMEGQPTARFDMSQYLTAGSPVPSLYLGSDANRVPAMISFDGLVMLVTPTSSTVDVEKFDFTVTARNASGSEDKQVRLDLHPVFIDGGTVNFTSDDYEEIRKLVSSEAEATDLPDTVISHDSIVGGAVSWAEDRMPVYAGNPRTLRELLSKRRAMIYYAAGLLTSTVRLQQDPRIITSAVPELELQNNLFAAAEREAVIAQERFVESGLADEAVDLLAITFEVVPDATQDVYISNWN